MEKGKVSGRGYDVGSPVGKALNFGSRYKRQTRLDSWGDEGQKKLAEARVLVVGAGGLGCPALLYLAGAGIGRLGIADDDNVSLDNLHRQILFRPDLIGRNKAEAASEVLALYNPEISLAAYPFRLEHDNLPSLLSDWDVIVDGSDNFSTKFLLHDGAYLGKKALAQASLHKWEAQVQFFPFDRRGISGDGLAGSYEGPCLRCLWPTQPEDGCVGTCAESGIAGPVAGSAGSTLASLVIAHVLGQEILRPGETWFFEMKSGENRKIRWQKNPDCPLCSKEQNIQRLLTPKTKKTEVKMEVSPKEIRPESFAGIIDIRETYEVLPGDRALLETFGLGSPQYLPLSMGLPNLKNFVEGKSYLVVCAHGVRSLNFAKKMNGQGKNFLSLSGGIEGLR